jgi:hypothetical protein
MITKEKLNNHIKHLQEKHDKLDKEIQDMYVDCVSDLVLEKAKKEKLRLKDEIERTRAQMQSL